MSGCRTLSPFCLCAVAVFALWVQAGFSAEHPDARFGQINASPYSLVRNTQQALSVDTAEMLPHLTLVIALDTGVFYRPLGLRDKESGDWLRSFVEHREQFNTRMHLGLWKQIDLGLELPLTIHQDAQLPGLSLDRSTRLVLVISYSTPKWAFSTRMQR